MHAHLLALCVCVVGGQISEFVFIDYFTLSLHNSLKENNSLPSEVDSQRLECELF